LSCSSAPEGEEALVRAYDDADFAWTQDQQGVHLGSSDVKLRPPDLARLGQLYLDRGRSDDEQLVSQAWIEQSTAPLVAAYRGLTEHYGFQWWVAADDGYFCALGGGGTAIVVDPARHVVVVVASQIDADHPEGMMTGNARALAEDILDEFAAND
jgi:CubicO group peptidase (beta-lactamase class C family)